MPISPETPEQLAEALRDASARGPLRVGGAFSKDAMGGPVAAAETTVSTAAMRRVLQYEPRDLTVSVEAGLPFSELTRLLAENGQMIPLDPPYGASATVGGVVAANCVGPRRRLYGTARDLIIGMKFATLEGRLVQSGGMVVKNVAGLDMGKLMIGSFGTLAALAVVNFKVLPEPPASRTFALHFDSAADAVAARNRVLYGVLQPAAVDLLNPAGAACIGLNGYTLLVRAVGNAGVLTRYEKELPGGERFESEEECTLWRRVIEFAPEFIASQTAGAVVRVSSFITQSAQVLESLSVPTVMRAGNGVGYACFEQADAAAEWMRSVAGHGWKCVMEYAPEEAKPRLDLWPCPGNDLELMKRVKQMFDPQGVLNRGRLYGRI